MGPALAVAGILLASCGGGGSITESFGLPSGRVSFSHSPVDLSGVIGFAPMGEANVLPKDHGGFPLREPFTFPPSVPAIAVADGVIAFAVRGTRSVLPIPDAPEELWGTTYDDWGLEIEVSGTMKAKYAHVTQLHPDLMERLGSQPADERGRNVRVPVEAGDTIGWLGPHAAMDFSVFDRELRLSFLNPSRYPRDHIYSANIIDYFDEPVRGELLSSALRQIPPRGGKVDYDVEGKISGNWFREGTTSFIQWSRQLAIVYDHIHGDRIFISDGSPMSDVPGFQDPGRPDIWWVRGNTPRPETVGVGDGVIKYTLISHGLAPDEVKATLGVMLVEMTEAGRIRVEVFKGVEDAAGFTPAAKIYVR